MTTLCPLTQVIQGCLLAPCRFSYVLTSKHYLPLNYHSSLQSMKQHKLASFTVLILYHNLDFSDSQSQRSLGWSWRPKNILSLSIQSALLLCSGRLLLTENLRKLPCEKPRH